MIASTLAATAAWAVEPFTVRDIRVEGLQRVEPGTIFGSLPLRVGDTYSDETGSAAIRALFELGLFKDVRLDVNNGVLVVIVEERPTVADVDFVGTKEFDKAALQKSLREVPALEEALYIMVRSHDAVGLSDLRDDAQRVLTTNYPRSDYLSRGFRAKEDPWWKVW